MSEFMDYNICNKRLSSLSVHPRYKERRGSRRSSLKPEITVIIMQYYQKLSLLLLIINNLAILNIT